MSKTVNILLLVVALLGGLTECQQSITIQNVVVNFLNRGEQTDFFVISNLGPDIDINNAYLAVGLNHNQEMEKTNAVVCKNVNGSMSIEHYYNDGYLPELMKATMPKVGLSNTHIMVDSGYIICQFTRDNSYPGLNRYFDSNLNEAYMLVSFGKISFGKNFKWFMESCKQTLDLKF